MAATTSAAPAPAEDDYVEEEVVTLQPIGPGLQNLEPEVDGVVTPGPRAPTPSFPVAGTCSLIKVIKEKDVGC